MALVQIDWHPPPRTLRQFGLIGVAASALFALLCYLRPFRPFASLPESAVGEVTLALGILAAYCLITAFAAPRALRPLYLVLTALSLPIGLLISYAVMGVVFFGVITPVGLVFRLIGRDALSRRFDAQAPTYWVRRRPPGDVRRYFRQF